MKLKRKLEGEGRGKEKFAFVLMIYGRVLGDCYLMRLSIFQVFLDGDFFSGVFWKFLGALFHSKRVPGSFMYG